jgi:hypothetical protein
MGKTRILLPAGWLLALGIASAEAQQIVDVDKLKPLLDFETGAIAGAPKGWDVTGKAFADSNIAHSGKWSARIESGSDYSAISVIVPVTFPGSTLTLRGFLKTENVTRFAGLWMRVSGNSGNPLAFDNMESQKLKGTTGWKEYSIEIPMASNAAVLFFGVVSEGGTTWADDLELLVDGKPVWEAPRVAMSRGMTGDGARRSR